MLAGFGLERYFGIWVLIRARNVGLDLGFEVWFDLGLRFV